MSTLIASIATLAAILGCGLLTLRLCSFENTTAADREIMKQDTRVEWIEHARLREAP